MIHNDQSVRLAVGDVALVDASRPVTYCADNGSEPWNTLRLPRHSLISHLGFEPEGGLYRPAGTRAGRLLLDLIRTTGDGEGGAISSADSYMQLAVYGLVGALLAQPEPSSGSRHSDKLFARIRGIIKHGCANPDFGPYEVAAEAGISLRYLQRLFTERGSTCTEFIYSPRLDQTAHLLHRRGFCFLWGVLLTDVWLSSYFGRLRSQHGGNFMHDSDLSFIPSIHGEWVRD